MRVVFSGDRYWTARSAVELVMRELPKGTVIVHGGAKGLDTIAGEVAKELGYEVEAWKPNWARYGKGAGPVRNAAMLDSGAEHVYAFHPDIESSKGTKDCVKQAQERDIPVTLIS